jgi:hypothetical protein
MFHCRAYLHLDFLVHLLPQFVLITHHDEETHSKKSGQGQYEKNNANYDLVGSCSHILNAAFTVLKAHLTADCRLKVCLAVNLQLK